MKFKFIFVAAISCMIASCTDSNSNLDFQHMQSLGKHIGDYSQSDHKQIKTYREKYCSTYPESIIKLMISQEIFVFFSGGDSIISRYTSDIDYMQNREYFNDFFIRSSQLRNLDIDFYSELSSKIESQIFNHESYKQFNRKNIKLKQLLADIRIDRELLQSDKVDDNKKEEILDGLQNKYEKSSEIRNDLYDLPLCIHSIIFLGITSSKDKVFIDILGSVNEVVSNNQIKKSKIEFDQLMKTFGE